MLAWIDLETTGLEPRHHHILEVACVVTDDDLQELASYSSLVLPIAQVAGKEPLTFDDFDPNNLVPQEGEDDTRSNAIYAEHFNNGLVDELKAEFATPGWEDRRSPRAVERKLSKFLTENCPEPVPLAGSSVHFDRGFLLTHMPKALRHLHYRNVDVSTVRELAKRWWPELATPPKGEKHRALDDIYESIRLLRYYRNEGFIG